jgi:hypothetical protein
MFSQSQTTQKSTLWQAEIAIEHICAANKTNNNTIQ